ncbi:MAG: TIGR01212 family radical SAM protein [Bacteroidales bacterium]|nr:TIGR01212 family radical SAM protein [Bacteroidales bacterium]
MSEVFNSYSKYIRETFGERVQKISVDAGFTCPNRDGTKGRGGCTYCNNDTFNPIYTSSQKTIIQQLNEGVAFFEPKYKAQKYLAYFQAYTNTYDSIKRLKALYDEALSHPKVIGLVISTRPDAITREIADLIEEYAKSHFVSVEIGIESTLDRSLNLLNRCHTYNETIDAFEILKNRNIHLGAHLIIGIPGESKTDFTEHAVQVSKLPIEFLKLHQLQIIKGTAMAKSYKNNSNAFELLSVNDYVEIVGEFLRHLRPDVVIERFSSESPKELLIAPFWGGLKNFEITEKVRKYMQFNAYCQGQLFK